MSALGRSLVLALALALSGCAAQPATSDAADDGDVSLDDSGVPHDAGSCTAAVVEATCSFRTPTRECEIACDFPADCGFRANVHWTDGYCCDPVDDGQGDEPWVDCRCENGVARCYAAFVPPHGPRAIPRSACECFRPADAGTDASIVDGGA